MQNYKYYLEKFGEYGEVAEVRQSMVTVEGLPGLRINEVVIFESGLLGQVIDISKDFCRVTLLQKTSPKSRERASRTDNLLTVPVSEELLGTMIDPMGKILSRENKKLKKIENRSIEAEIGGIDKRAKITKQLLTGVTLVDILLPLGNGQKELIIGDRKTGKTSFLLTTVKNQIKSGKIVIFAAIGKKKTDIKKIHDYFVSEKLINRMVFVVSGSDYSENLIYLTPFTAMTIAEYFRDKGIDSLVVFDDLSTHAKIYRQIGLNSDKFPGRESYPGDIFYLHAHLLERAGNFRPQKGDDISITCLPVAETIEGDMTGYITTNLMGITDGHIYFDRSIFTKGRRPAINLPLSVTRVGRQTQSSIYQQANHEITAFLTEYESLQNLAHFGAELSPKVKLIITKGERIIQIFDQKYGEIISQEKQLILMALAYSEDFFDTDIKILKEKILKEKDVKLIEKVGEAKSFKELLEYLEKNKKFLLC